MRGCDGASAKRVVFGLRVWGLGFNIDVDLFQCVHLFFGHKLTGRLISRKHSIQQALDCGSQKQNALLNHVGLCLVLSQHGEERAV